MNSTLRTKFLTTETVYTQLSVDFRKRILKRDCFGWTDCLTVVTAAAFFLLDEWFGTHGLLNDPATYLL